MLLECFGTKQFTKTFPQVFGTNSTAKHFQVRSEKTLAAFCASFPFHWAANGALITGHCIGSVCSAEKFRGRGLAKDVITMAEIHAAQNGAQFTFLFSELDSFYQKLGYRPYGIERFTALAMSPAINSTATQNLSHLVKLSENLSTQSLRYGFTQPGEKISDPKTAAIWNLLTSTSHSSENILSFSEFRLLLTIPGVEIHTLWEHETPRAVFFVGKGADFRDVAHSACAQNKLFLAKLFAQFFDKFPGRSLLFMLPPEPGLQFPELQITTTTSYFAKILSTPQHKPTLIQQLLESGALYPRSFQSI